MKTFDYVIVGSGAAGCVLAHRLSANPAVTVALIEAGGSDRHPLIRMPKGLAKIVIDPSRTWAYPAEPEKGNGFQAEHWARGRVLGGSTSIDGMLYLRGQPADFDEIAAQSSSDWSWEHIGAAYQALESHELGSAPTRGARGPLRVTLPDRRSPLTEAMVQAGVEMGWPRKLDVNEPDNGEAVGYAPRTIWRGRRQSAAVAFLEPIRGRPNLTVIVDSLVDKVHFDGRRATGVATVGSPTQPAQQYGARREVILCGGALASPGILQRSGIGPGELLRQLGIPVLKDNPQVGQNLRAHRAIIVQWKLRPPGSDSDNSLFSGWRLIRNVAEYYLTHGGPMSSASHEIGAWMRSSPQVPQPDVQFLATPCSFDFTRQRAFPEPFPGMSIAGYPLRPQSRGEINIKSSDPNELPQLRPRYYSADADRLLMIETVKLARRYAHQPALRQAIEVETYPGPDCQTDDRIIEAYDRYGTCGYQAVGSCRMGNDAESVVDPQLRVRGVEALRVMDTSIIPQLPAGNTNGPTMAMAWRAADIITRDT
ncbi:MAG TPA: GMC family oxidoreductase N-terminal domain-containing protein [Steroidobacteraceae bacterium]|nr:GMC family oxidoreductase N-terminal domain-containing protein [Steroidobacteraceae bacterium]